jgi:hypothetical protein
MKATFLLFVPVLLCSCADDFNNQALVRKGTVVATAYVHHNKIQELKSLEVDCRKLDSIAKQDLWIGFQNGEHICIAEISLQLLEKYSAKRYAGDTSCVGGYSFHFEDKSLVSFTALTFGFPNNEREFPVVGSATAKSELSLPCSLPEFIKVFGQPDEIVRQHGW